jgi:ABC-2 type transport system permease protein
MLFLCGLFVPIVKLPVFLRPVSYCLPLTYGTDILKGMINTTNTLSPALSFAILLIFVVLLFVVCRYNINRKWIL